MKNLRNEKDINLAAELSHLIEERKAAAKREKELKKYFTDKAGKTDKAIKAGDILILLTDKERSGLDRKALETEYGVEKIAEFVKVTEYVQVDVKGA